MNILIPIDGTDHSLFALDLLKAHRALFGEAPDIRLFLALEPVSLRTLGYANEDRDAFHRAETERVAARVREVLGEDASALRIECGSTGSPADLIAEAAERLQSQLIIMGSRGIGSADELLAGSVTRDLLAKTNRALLILRGRLPESHRRLRIGLAVDDSPESLRASEFVLTHRALFGEAPDFRILHADNERAPVSGIAAALKRSRSADTIERSRARVHDGLLQPLADRLSVKGATARIEVLDGPPVDMLAEYAEDEKLDLLVMGSRGRTGLRAAVLGSTGLDVLKASDVPLLLVR